VALADRVLSSLQATWLDTEDALGQPLLRRPEWSASWTLHGGLGKRWHGDVTLVWVGARADVDPLSFDRIELGSHLTANLAAACEVLEGLEITLRIRNIADQSYQEAAGYPAPGRRVMGGLRWRL
jgi:outer membrane cobalamin receptor